MILPIYTYGHPILNLSAVNIVSDTLTDIDKYIQDVFETMHNAKGLGLAAPQIGHNLKLFVIDVEISDGVIFKGIFINPKILSASGPIYTMTEGCLSLPGISVQINRPGTIEMEYCDENWKQHKQIFEGIPARIIQHEYDHLNGKLFVDHLSVNEREKILLDLVNIKQKKIKTTYPIK